MHAPPGGAAWGPAPTPQGSTLNEQVARTWAAMRRYKWLIVAVIAIGLSAGFALTRINKPNYTVVGSIMMAR
jgi:uncharacterized protein involved in exopolysaccharide biosynthesis